MNEEIRECRLYSIKDIAKITGLPERTIYNHIKEGRIHALDSKFKKKIRVAGKFLIKYLNGDCCDGNAVFGGDNHSIECEAK